MLENICSTLCSSFFVQSRNCTVTVKLVVKNVLLGKLAFVITELVTEMILEKAIVGYGVDKSAGHLRHKKYV